MEIWFQGSSRTELKACTGRLPAALLTRPKGGNKPNVHQLTKRQTTYVLLRLAVQSRPTLCDPINYRLPGSSVHGSLQARKLEWVAIPFSWGSSPPRDWTQDCCIAGRFFTSELPGKPSQSDQGLNLNKWHDIEKGALTIQNPAAIGAAPRCDPGSVLAPLLPFPIWNNLQIPIRKLTLSLTRKWPPLMLLPLRADHRGRGGGGHW